MVLQYETPARRVINTEDFIVQKCEIEKCKTRLNQDRIDKGETMCDMHERKYRKSL